jgi:hypothetical protein
MPNLIDLDEVKPAKLRDIVQFLAAEIDYDARLQILVAIFSLAAIVMVASTGSLHRWGFVVGFASQPLWIVALWRARTPGGSRMWGMLMLAAFYAVAWALGIFERFS